MNPVSSELQPFIIYRVSGQQVECALWQLKEGGKALALFLSSDTATAYRDSTQLVQEWKVYQPARPALLELLKAAFHSGVLYAVLDPDLEKAKQIFQIKDILAVAGERTVSE